MSERRVVISGIGCVTPFGVGAQHFWDNIAHGKTASRLIDQFDVSKLPTKFAATVPLNDQDLGQLIENQKSLKTMCRSAKFAIIAAEEAFKDSGIDKDEIAPFRLGTSIGAGGLGLWDLDHANKVVQITFDSIESTNGDINYADVWKKTLEYMHPLLPLKALSNIPTAHIAINYNARGNCQTITTACTSSAQAIGEAYRHIKYGVADVMIAGGHDSIINPNGMVAFSMLGVISKNNSEYQSASRPFDKRRDGFMLGEGSAIFILEDLEHCRQRGGEFYGEIAGYASTSDAFRLTDEPPGAWGSIEAMKLGLADARLNPENVDYINAHGTGTKMNDKTETFAIKSVFDDHAYTIPVSSTKSMIGHLVAAAGCVEFAACVLAMKNQQIPPTINYEMPDSECDLDYVPNTSRTKELKVIMSNSFGFGGQNACLILSNQNV